MDRENLTESVSRHNLYILTALWSFIFGILIATLVGVTPLVSVLIWIVALVIYLADRHALITIVLCFFALGAFRYDIKDFHELKPVGNTGVVVSEPERRESDTRFVVKTGTGERVLVTADLFAEVEYGDEVSLIGNAKTLKPGGYADYLAKDDIFYTMDRAKVEVLSHGHGNPVLGMLQSIKKAFVGRVRDILPEPESSLLSGLVVAGKGALPVSVLEEFRRSGIVHIVVLSGFNITIIAQFIFIILGRFGRRVSAGAAVAAVVLFTLMAGAPATVLRGAVMVLAVMFGKFFEREGNAPRILLSTAVLMLMWNPKMLVYDASFQLSFLAMLGLIYIAPVLQRFAEKILPALGREGRSRPIFSRLTELVTTTFGTQLAVFPFILHSMGNFSTVFLLANLAVLPLIPVAMLLGFVATLIAFVSIGLAFPLTFAAHILLAWILFVAEFLGNLSFASLEIENFPLWGSLLIYFVLGSILWRARDSLRPTSSLGS